MCIVKPRKGGVPASLPLKFLLVKRDGKIARLEQWNGVLTSCCGWALWWISVKSSPLGLLVRNSTTLFFGSHYPILPAPTQLDFVWNYLTRIRTAFLFPETNYFLHASVQHMVNCECYPYWHVKHSFCSKANQSTSPFKNNLHVIDIHFIYRSISQWYHWRSSLQKYVNRKKNWVSSQC